MVVKNNLWVFGDSTSRHHGLLDNDQHFINTPGKKEYFTDHIKEYFNLEKVKNYARHGASNDDISFILLSKISSFKEGDVVLLQKTYPTRLNFYDKDNFYTPCHYAISTDHIDFNIENKTVVDTIKKYIKHYVIDNTENFNDRDTVRFYNYKKLIEKLNVKCILWDSSILNSSKLKLTTITEESKGIVNDLHIGFSAQKHLANTLLDSYNSNLEFITYNYKTRTVEDISTKIKQFERLVNNIRDTGYVVKNS